MRQFLVILLALISLTSLASDVKLVSANYTYVSDDADESPRQAKMTALQRAKVKALEDNFGLDVSSVSNMIQRNMRIGDSISSSNDLFALRETSVRGEWIETTEEKVISQNYTNGLWQVQVYVKGRARSYAKEKAQIKFSFNNKYQKANHIDQFFDGDNIYLRFSSPVNGMLCVYLVDEKKDVFCLLPYSTEQLGCQEIVANKNYLFFSQIADKQADEYTMRTNMAHEQNIIYLVFSPNKFTKANDSDENIKWWEEQRPRQLSYSDFINWLSRNQLMDEEMIVKTEVITIFK
ncbi:MAG: hypothetical protein KBT27_01980 [Prevotellaceae bacterium]|nr:hypothetical protein [Candidatus Faecinaster equi]